MGIAIDLRRLGRSDECLHESVVEVTTSGLRRMVCENCGHVTIRRTAELSGDIDRSRFGRRSERSAERGDRTQIDETRATKEALGV